VPELGRYRCSREGLVYYSNRGGPGGLGYAICLQCGRAEADSESGGPSPAPALVDHKPLRYRMGQDLCPGNDKPFSVKRNLALGLETTTDVFELQPQYTLSWAGAHALVIALREALAQELGVEADEMGFAVGQSQNALGAPAVSLFLFDRATGGAGFAVSLEHLMRPVLRRVEQILDCVTPGCEKACAACVLTSDAPSGRDELDRSAALAFLQAHLRFPDELGPDDRFVNSAFLSLAPLDEIDRELRRSARSTVTIFLPNWSDPAALQDWPLGATVRGWPSRRRSPPHSARRKNWVYATSRCSIVSGSSQRTRLSLRTERTRWRWSTTTRATAVERDFKRQSALTPESKPEEGLGREPEPRLPGPTWGRPGPRREGRGFRLYAK
jgi:DEAD/DEAH box helicase domain-containing protein